METPKTEKIFLLVLLVIALFLTFTALYPFLTTIIVAAAFTVILKPVYEWIKKKLGDRAALSSLITVILFIIVLAIPIFFIGSVIFKQSQNAYQFITQGGNTSDFIQQIDYSINKLMPDAFPFDTYGKINSLITLISNNIGNFFSTTLNTLVLFLLTMFTMFYMFKNGEQWKEGLIKIIPLSPIHINEILESLKNSINRVLKGSFIIAIVQGVLAWAGYWIFGIPNPALWGVIAGLASFIPTFGTSIISIPAVIFLLITGLPLHALGLLIWSMILVGSIDNVLSPYIISKNSEIPPIFILFAILGGLSLVGPVGILIGPLILSFLYSIVSIYRKIYQEDIPAR